MYTNSDVTKVEFLNRVIFYDHHCGDIMNKGKRFGQELKMGNLGKTLAFLFCPTNPGNTIQSVYQYNVKVVPYRW
jgi:hypothetical protein